MKRKIYINESQLQVLKESTKEVTFESFFNNVKSFLSELLTDPLNAKVSDLFTSHGHSQKDLLKKMIDRGLITRKENIKELPYEPNGKKEAKMIIKYSVPRKNFDKKMRRLYLEMFPEPIEENAMIMETDCGGAMQGGGGNPDAGQFTVRLGTGRREFYTDSLKRNEDSKNHSISMNRVSNSTPKRRRHKHRR